MNEYLWLIKHPLTALRIFNFVSRVTDYAQKSVNYSSVMKWIFQFDETDRVNIISLLPHIRYYSQRKTEDILTKHNAKLLQRLRADGVTPDHTIYVTVDDPGSSSHIMLNLLRDAAFLQRRGFRLFDSRDVLGLVKCTNELGNGAIIYIDDFAGTGNQFLKSRNYVAENVPLIGQFSEFLLLPCVCEESLVAISKVGVDIISNHTHTKNERPLHPESILIAEDIKARLVQFSGQIDPTSPLGYKGLASMVVFFRNAPNGLPVLFRGNVGQNVKSGILPRSTDFL